MALFFAYNWPDNQRGRIHHPNKNVEEAKNTTSTRLHLPVRKPPIYETIKRGRVLNHPQNIQQADADYYTSLNGGRPHKQTFGPCKRPKQFQQVWTWIINGHVGILIMHYHQRFRISEEDIN